MRNEPEVIRNCKFQKLHWKLTNIFFRFNSHLAGTRKVEEVADNSTKFARFFLLVFRFLALAFWVFCFFGMAGFLGLDGEEMVRIFLAEVVEGLGEAFLDYIRGEDPWTIKILVILICSLGILLGFLLIRLFVAGGE